VAVHQAVGDARWASWSLRVSGARGWPPLALIHNIMHADRLLVVAELSPNVLALGASEYQAWYNYTVGDRYSIGVTNSPLPGESFYSNQSIVRGGDLWDNLKLQCRPRADDCARTAVSWRRYRTLLQQS
jgi:hypothetical protein